MKPFARLSVILVIGTLITIVVLNAACPGTNSFLPALIPDAFEPDNTNTGAAAIAAGESQARTIFPLGDRDFVKFTLLAPSSATFDVTAPNQLTLRLYDAFMNMIEYNDGSANGGAARIVRDGGTALAAGSYFLRVDGRTNSTSVNYELTAAFTVGEQTGYSIAGTIKRSDGTALSGATVSTGTVEATSDANGGYLLANLLPGIYSLSATTSGLEFYPPAVSRTIVSASLSNVDFVAYDAGATQRIDAVSASDGTASFTVGSSTARVHVFDLRTGNNLSAVNVMLLTDGSEGAYLVTDSSGVFLPRLAAGFSAPGGPVGRTIDQTTEIGLVGSLALGGQNVDAATVDRIQTSLWPYVLSVLSTTQTSVQRTALDTSIPALQGAPTTAVEFVAEHPIATSQNLITLTTMAYNQGTNIGDTAWNKFNETRGYGGVNMFDLLAPSAAFGGVLANGTSLTWTLPLDAEPAAAVSTGTISGTIIDSTTAGALANVTVTLYPFGRTTQTDGSGAFEFTNVSVFHSNGSPHWLSATLTGYDPDFRIVTVTVDGVGVANVALNPILTSMDKYRIVLDWGQNPSDLDSHLWSPSGAHVYYVTRGSLAAYPFMNLDVDDVTSYGPETVTIRSLETGTYTYAIHHFAGTGDFTTSSARVKVFDQTGPIRLFVAPTQGAGRWWHVFTLDADTGTITPVNTIQSGPPIDF